MPHFQLILGGEWERNAASFGLPVLALPAKRIPEAVTRLSAFYLASRSGEESFQRFVARVGKAEIKKLLEVLAAPPEDTTDRSFFSDWGDAREYSTGDLGVGECAGEVVSLVEFGLTSAERQVFEAQVSLEGGEVDRAGAAAYQAMVQAAKALLTTESRDVSDDAEEIVGEFRTRFYDTQKFFDPYAGGKFAHYLFGAHRKINNGGYTAESVHHLIEEAQLFIEASHSCYNRMAVIPNP